MRILNLYAGLGGNRKLWDGDIQVTAVEMNEKIAGVYAKNNPGDTVIIGDAHQYLIDHHEEFDFIWSSPPCQSHSRMAKFTRHKNKKYPSMMLYEEIIFLQHFFKGKFVVENVKPYYDPLITPSKTVGRHYFWSNFEFSATEEPQPKGFINKTNVEGMRQLKEWLGIEYEKNIYYDGNHCPAQVLRNCVHPKVGKQIFDALRESVKNS